MIALFRLSFISFTVAFLESGALAKDHAIEAAKIKPLDHHTSFGHSSEPPKKFFVRHPRDDVAAQMGIDPSMTLVETVLPPLKDKEGNVLTISDLCPMGTHGRLYAMAGAGGVFEISLADWTVKTFEEPRQGVLAADGKCFSSPMTAGPYFFYEQYEVSSGKTTFHGYDLSTGELVRNLALFSGRVQSIVQGKHGMDFAMQDGTIKIFDFSKVEDSPDLAAAILPGAKIVVFPLFSKEVYIGSKENSDKIVTSFFAHFEKDGSIIRNFDRQVEDATIGVSMDSYEGGIIFSDGFDVHQIINSEDVILPLAGNRYQSGSKDGLAPQARFAKMSAVGYSSALRTFYIADSNGLRRMTPGMSFNIANPAFLDYLTPVQAFGYGFTGNKKYDYDLHFGPGKSITQTSEKGKGSTSLGALQASNYLGEGKFSFDDGDACKGGIKRRGTLQLLCAGSVALFVTETERCVYEVLYMSPDFCE